MALPKQLHQQDDALGVHRDKLQLFLLILEDIAACLKQSGTDAQGEYHEIVFFVMIQIDSKTVKSLYEGGVLEKVLPGVGEIEHQILVRIDLGFNFKVTHVEVVGYAGKKELETLFDEKSAFLFIVE